MAALRLVLLRATSSNLARFSAMRSRQPVAASTLSRSFCPNPEEKVTHTGQIYDEGDYRKLRFIDREKEVNEQFAIDLVHEEPPIEVNARSVYCDGGGGALGHPKVYINLDQPGPQICPYCGLRYISVLRH